MTLVKFDGDDVEIMGISRHSQRGWNPEWEQNGPPPMGGTQVDSGKCENGAYANVVVVTLALPPPWFVFPIITVVVGFNAVANC